MASVVEKIALSHPDISIRFIQNNQNKLYTSGNNNLKDLIYTVFGREITANLLEVSASCPGVTITGYIGKPEIMKIILSMAGMCAAISFQKPLKRPTSHL